jgi:hypothetical protein
MMPKMLRQPTILPSHTLNGTPTDNAKGMPIIATARRVPASPGTMRRA